MTRRENAAARQPDRHRIAASICIPLRPVIPEVPRTLAQFGFRVVRRLTPFGAGAVRVALVGLALFGLALFGLALFGLALFGLALFGLALFGLALFGLALFGLALFGLAPFGLAPFGLAPFGLAPFGLAPFIVLASSLRVLVHRRVWLRVVVLAAGCPHSRGTRRSCSRRRSRRRPDVGCRLSFPRRE